jgi:hypothetical protein
VNDVFVNADRNRSHDRPDGVSDASVAAVGKVSEALEWVERARGHLYDFHQMMGHADVTLGEAAQALHDAGHPDLARRLRHELVGLDVLEGRWTFEVVEEFDHGYYARFRAEEQQVRNAVVAGRQHVFEAEMKAREQRREPE